MFDPERHRNILVRTRNKPYAIVQLTPHPRLVSCTAAKNPRLRFMRVVRSRHMKEAFAIVRLSDLATVAYYPPMEDP